MNWQKLQLDTIEIEQSTPSLSQAKHIKQMSREGTLNDETMLSVMSEQDILYQTKYKEF